MFWYYNRKAYLEFRRDRTRRFRRFWRRRPVDFTLPRAPYKDDRTTHRINRRYNREKRWATAFFYNV